MDRDLSCELEMYDIEIRWEIYLGQNCLVNDRKQFSTPAVYHIKSRNRIWEGGICFILEILKSAGQGSRKCQYSNCRLTILFRKSVYFECYYFRPFPWWYWHTKHSLQ